MNQPTTENRDLVLPPGSYAFVQAENNGSIKTHVGPCIVTLSGQDRPVEYDPEHRTYQRVGQDQAVQTNIAAEEGDYVILENPAENHPDSGTANATPASGLKMGSRIVIPGPCNFALWPGQSAETLDGHQLSSNEFLIVRVYNEEEARKNWTQAKTIVKTDGDNEGKDESKETKQVSLSAIDPQELNLGQRIIVRGDQVSFYIPPTGVEVVEDLVATTTDTHVREAVTLERLEYCILVDENGDKRYERGPAVVFPTPTEHFVMKGKARKFRAIELTSRSGLHIKVIHDYKDDDGDYKAGDELFITGAEQAIYFPRIEHSIIKYGERDQHFAVAVPRGEGRYVMNRVTGEIETARGPKMLLPDPRDKVVVRRILSDKEVELWYPDNNEALDYNRDLQKTLEAASLESMDAAMADDAQDYGIREGAISERMYASRTTRRGDAASVTSSASSSAVKGHHGDEFKRGTAFTPPRTVTLDTKYEGVAAISPFVGYAVLVVNKDGKREVHQGPKTILLDYDESLEVLSISTSKPKTTDRLKRTVYLRIRNNKVSDIIDVETKDHVNVQIKVSLLVNFEGVDPELWFQAENYVKLLCDHVRSVLKGAVQKISIENFYANHVAVVRDSILGASSMLEDETTKKMSRPGMIFTENGMIVRDVEVLGFDIQDREVYELLSGAQRTAVRNNIELQQAQTKLDRDLQQEEIIRQTAEARFETQMHGLKLTAEGTQKHLAVTIAKLAADTKEAADKQKCNEAWEASKHVEHNWDQKRKKEIHDQQNKIDEAKQKLFVVKLKAEVDAAVARFEAGKGGLSEALIALNNSDVMMKVAQATSVQSMIGGKSFVDVVQQIFAGTQLEGLATKIAMHLPMNHHTGDED